MEKDQKISLTKGYTFYFKDDEENKIEAWFSIISGLEKVFVNGQLVSSQRNYSTDSTNTFNISNNEYSTNFKVSKIFKGPFICTLNKNGIPYKRQIITFPEIKTKNRILWIGIGVVVGVTTAFIQRYFELSYGYTFVFGIVLFVSIFSFSNIGKGYKTPTIKEEVL